MWSDTAGRKCIRCVGLHDFTDHRMAELANKTGICRERWCVTELTVASEAGGAWIRVHNVHKPAALVSLQQETATASGSQLHVNSRMFIYRHAQLGPILNIERVANNQRHILNGFSY